jgi:hypothetical protein
MLTDGEKPENRTPSQIGEIRNGCLRGPKNQRAARGENLLLTSTNDDRKQKELEEWSGSIRQKAKLDMQKPRRP